MKHDTAPAHASALLASAEPRFPQWEVVKDLVDEMIDLSLNYRQSGHPGGSRSKAHAVMATMLSGAMRWDILHPWKTFGDRFVLSAGHTVPLIYATLAVLNECLRTRHRSASALRIPCRWRTSQSVDRKNTERSAD